MLKDVREMLSSLSTEGELMKQMEEPMSTGNLSQILSAATARQTRGQLGVMRGTLHPPRQSVQYTPMMYNCTKKGRHRQNPVKGFFKQEAV